MQRREVWIAVGCLAGLITGIAYAGKSLPGLGQPAYSITFDRAAPRARAALIIPGAGEQPSDAAYLAIAEAYQARRITPVLVAIDWARVRARDVAPAVEGIAAGIREDFPGARIYIMGFSFGAVMAYRLAAPLHPEHVMLCSMSPLFDEDIQRQPWIIRRMMTYFLDGHPLAYDYRDPGLHFLYGEHDSFIIHHGIIAHRRALFAHNRTLVVKNARHKLEGGYLETVQRLIAEIPHE